jgi:hypothetical protein
MDTLQELQRWYHAQCNGDWEHRYGVEIGALDNPGWRVVIDLVNTDWEDRPFTEVRRLEPEADRIHCRIRESKWEGYGGPFMLEEILRTFLSWAAVRRHCMAGECESVAGSQ